MRHVSVLGSVAAGLLFSSLAFGADPATQDFSIPARAGTYSFTWTGTVLPGAGQVGTEADTGCATDPTADAETFNFTGPNGLYDAFTVEATYEISWDVTASEVGSATGDDIPDLALTVLDPDSNATSADGNTTPEVVVTQNKKDGAYQALACTDISTGPTDYRGKLTVTVKTKAVQTAPPSADPHGLEFSAGLVDELQYVESEPLVTIDGDGTIYTCGPTGSPDPDVAQASLDGGDQFNRLGDPASGHIATLGGGDCALATGLDRNSKGNFQLAYAGLSALAQFTVSTSDDKGQTIQTSPMSSSPPDVDRQWLAFTDATNVFMNYRLTNVTTAAGSPFAAVQHSNDGGLTYSAPVSAASGIDYVGPIRSMTKSENPQGNGMAALYFPWVLNNSIGMALSVDAGATWTNCLVTESVGAPNSMFPIMDHDTAGNVYLAYTDQADFNTYLVAIPAAEVKQCTDAAGIAEPVTKRVKATARVQMNRDHAVTSVFPWVAAGGAPGRVAVSFYGSPAKGRPDDATIPHVWDVFVGQTLNAFDSSPTVAQVKATTHPLHYDQICMSGLDCVTGGDRGLADFFAIAYNKTTGELNLVFNRSGKVPGDGSKGGPLTSPVFLRQISGPSNGGGTVARNNRQVVRQASSDPEGDAYGFYSSLMVPMDRLQLPALDLRSVSVDSAVDFQGGGKPLADGGMTITMKVKDLSDAALTDALSQTNGQRLIWMFYYWDGFTPHSAAAIWDGSAFTFGTSAPGDASLTCSNEGCKDYQLDTPLDGVVDQASGTIRVTVPLTMLTALTNVPAPARSPAAVPARGGDRIYSAAAYTLVDLSTPETQQPLMTVDNTPAMDFVVPAGGGVSNESACLVPGITMVTSPSGAQYQESLPTGQDDLRAVYFAEPVDQADKLVITLKVDNLNPAPPPGGRWMVYLQMPGHEDRYFVAMSTADSPTPEFNYGTVGTEDIGPEAFGAYETLGTIDGTWAADGTIQFILDTASGPFAVKAGDVITNIGAAVRQTSSPSTTNNIGLTSDAGSAGKPYTVVKNHCAAAGGKVSGSASGGESHGLLLGGSLGLFTLLPLFGAGFLRRRKHH